MTRISTLFTLVFALFALVQGAWAVSLSDLEGSGTADEPYLIKNLNDWTIFAWLVNQTNENFNGKYVKLDAQIDNIQESVGIGTNHPFKGTFDGDGHGLVLDFGKDTYYSAPFGSVENAVIKNVQVGAKASSEYGPFGEIIVEDNGSALVGVAKGTTRIENVQISNDVGIRIKPSLGPTQRHLGGLVGYAAYGNLTLKDIKFSGKFLACKDENGIDCEYNSVGGLVGTINRGVTLTLDNCIFRGDAANVTGDFHPISTYIGEVWTGAISINDDHSRATINGAYNGSEKASIPGEIAVDEVVLNRTFTPNAYSTIVLPFGIALSNVSGATFYTLTGFTKVGDTWKNATAQNVEVDGGSLLANTPYLVKTEGKTISFTGSVILKTVENPTTELSPWKFRGTYGRVNFGDSSETILGRAYGFTAQAQNGYSIGQFAKAGSGAYIPPMRAYLVYNDANSNAKDAGGLGLGGAAALPDVIEVKIMDEQGKVTETVVLNPATGAISKDRWFDVQGRELKAKPTIKGRYLHNGKIEVVK